MGIRKDIEIDGQMVAFKASAAIPRTRGSRPPPA